MVDSTFHENEQWKNRKFIFSLTANGVSNESVKVLPNGEQRTSITLSDYLERYAILVPENAETIAHRIIEHCLEYFVLKQMPQIVLKDSSAEQVIDLWERYKDSIDTEKKVEFDIQGEQFRINHFTVRARAGLVHKITYCGNQRVVKEEKLANKIPNLTGRLTNRNDESVVYMGYIAGSYLDSHINQQRTDFDFAAESLFDNGEEDLREILQNRAISLAADYLTPLTAPVKAEKEDRIRAYVEDVSPQYKFIVKSYPEMLDNIPANTTDIKLEIELYRVQHTIEENLKAEGQELLLSASQVDVEDEESYEALVRKLSHFLEDWNELGKADLAKYIVKRKAMLTFLDKSLSIQDNDRYVLENAIHSLIFPLRKTSDEIGFEQQNLWILDEKLVYHHYLASDIPLKKNEAVSIDDRDRPDIIIFDRPIAATNMNADTMPYGAVVIFEFKRPMRTNYSDVENPIDQVLGYVEKIRNGDATDRHGRPFIVTDSTSFYCYIVGDLTKNLEQHAKKSGLTMTPDQLGFFGYNQNYRAYIEVISYTKLINDAKKRNQVLFEKLNIKGEI